ncbi:MAG: cation:proton antiporter [Bacilli bacterium]|jgi:Kef-type K+ transport system membrane component KefB|nr:cation:proton antiporter [Bacilli bacterium]
MFSSSIAFTLLYIMVFLILGLLSSRLMKLIHFPNVTGYLLVGILFGPYCLGAIVDGINGGKDILGLHTLFGSPLTNANPAINVMDISWISGIALSFIAFTIGQSFNKTALQRAGKRILVTTFTEALGASLLVFLGCMIAHFIDPEAFPWGIILTLSAIASATAPAATVLVIRQYHAHGKVVDTLLPVVALDDAIALLLYSVLFSLGKALSGGTVDVYTLLVIPLMEIFISLGLGIGIGFFLVFIGKFFKSRDNRSIWISAFLLAIGALSSFTIFPEGNPLHEFQLQPLLCAMMVGAVYCNKAEGLEKVLGNIDHLTPGLFLMFFVISGAELDLSIYYRDPALLGLFLPLAALYLVLRSGGKYLGAYVGSFSEKNCDPNIRKYLGFMLLPQAGVAIGLATASARTFTMPFKDGYSYGDIIVCVVLSTMMIYELAGALVTKIALIKAGQIDGMGPNKVEIIKEIKPEKKLPPTPPTK